MFLGLYGLLTLVILLTRGRRFEETIGLKWVTTFVLRKTLVSISNATSFKNFSICRSSKRTGLC